MACVALAFACVMPPCELYAQSQNYGAPFLLAPLGAHVVGQGEAAVADTSLGTESMWWNPAGLARLRTREIAVHHSFTLAATSDMIAAAVPSKLLGTLAGAYYLVNLGESEKTDSLEGPLGTLTNRYHLFQASYASPVGKRLSAGISAKFILLRFVCSGCDVSAQSLEGSTSAFDAGVQYILPTSIPITIGASVRNLGPALQFKDEQQADPLPRIVQVGATVQIPNKTLQKSDASVSVQSDVLVSPAFQKPIVSVGMNLMYKAQLTARAGYRSRNGNEGSTGAFAAGFGFNGGKWQIDVARNFTGTAAAAGVAPTYASVRFSF